MLCVAVEDAQRVVDAAVGVEVVAAVVALVTPLAGVEAIKLVHAYQQTVSEDASRTSQRQRGIGHCAEYLRANGGNLSGQPHSQRERLAGSDTRQ